MVTEMDTHPLHIEWRNNVSLSVDRWYLTLDHVLSYPIEINHNMKMIILKLTAALRGLEYFPIRKNLRLDRLA